MKHYPSEPESIKELTQLKKALFRYESLDDLELEEISDRIKAINATFNDDTTDEEFDIINQCEDAVAVAEQYWAAIDLECEREQESEERKYASMPR